MNTGTGTDPNPYDAIIPETNVEAAAHALMQGAGLASQLFDRGTMGQMVDVLIKAAPKEPRAVIVYTLRVMIKNGFGDSSNDLRFILEGIPRKSLLWKDDEAFAWALALCEVLYVPNPPLRLVMHNSQWRLILWCLVDAPITTKESPVLYNSKDCNEFLGHMVNLTSSTVLHNGLCQMCEMEEGLSKEWMSLCSALIYALCLNVQHAQAQGRIRFRRANLEKAKQRCLKAEQRYNLIAGLPVLILSGETKDQTTKPQEKKDTKKSEPYVIPFSPAIEDAFDRRIERTVFILNKFLLQGKINLFLEADDDSMFALAMQRLRECIGIVQTKCHLALQYPRLTALRLQTIHKQIRKVLDVQAQEEVEATKG